MTAHRARRDPDAHSQLGRGVAGPTTRAHRVVEESPGAKLPRPTLPRLESTQDGPGDDVVAAVQVEELIPGAALAVIDSGGRDDPGLDEACRDAADLLGACLGIAAELRSDRELRSCDVPSATRAHRQQDHQLRELDWCEGVAPLAGHVHAVLPTTSSPPEVLGGVVGRHRCGTHEDHREVSKRGKASASDPAWGYDDMAVGASMGASPSDRAIRLSSRRQANLVASR